MTTVTSGAWSLPLQPPPWGLEALRPHHRPQAVDQRHRATHGRGIGTAPEAGPLHARDRGAGTPPEPATGTEDVRTHLSPEALRIEKRRPAITRSEGRHDQKIRPYNRLSRVRGSGPGGPPLRGRTALDTPARGRDQTTPRNCSDLWGSTGHQASYRGAAKARNLLCKADSSPQT